jgi:hypothetical protein
MGLCKYTLGPRSTMKLVGFLAVGCSFAQTDLGFQFVEAGLAAASAGSYMCVTNFKKWIENL